MKKPYSKIVPEKFNPSEVWMVGGVFVNFFVLEIILIYLFFIYEK